MSGRAEDARGQQAHDEAGQNSLKRSTFVFWSLWDTDRL